MRLSADLLSQAEQRPNPLGERELVLRGYAIPSVEHLGATQDAYDAIDLSDNRISIVDNFPRLKRLSSLYFSRNLVEAIDGANLKKNLPNLENLVLTDNRIRGLHDLAAIGTGCPKLKFLSLVGNPVVRRQHYRLYAIYKIPTLKVLDFTVIKRTEREKANRLAQSAAGAALESDVKIEAREAMATAKTLTFVPGAGRSAKESFTANFTPEQKAKIREMVANAKSPAEIEQIENSVKRGVFPSFGNDTSIPPPPPPPLNELDRKRDIEGEDSDTTSKKPRL